MKHRLLRLWNRKSDLKTLQICTSAEAVCAVALGAQVRRVYVHRLRVTGGCEVEGFDELPMFSRLIICLAARAARKKIDSAPSDRADLDRATALAASVAPSQHESQQLPRLAREEAEQVVERRWNDIRRMAHVLAQTDELDGESVTRIALQSGKRKRRAQRVGSRPPARAASSMSWLNGIVARCAAIFSGGNSRATAARRAGSSKQRLQRRARDPSGRQARSTVRP